MVDRKIIQVSTANDGLVLVLCDDGSLWRYRHGGVIGDVDESGKITRNFVPAEWIPLKRIPKSEITDDPFDDDEDAIVSSDSW